MAVYTIDKDTPLLVLGYRYVAAIHQKPLESQIKEVLGVAEGAGTHELARRTFLRVLNMNAKKVLPAYEPGTSGKKYSKKKWKVSFLLPLGPLPMTEIGRLTTAAGCEVCGTTKGASRCTRCLSVVYCSPRKSPIRILNGIVIDSHCKYRVPKVRLARAQVQVQRPRRRNMDHNRHRPSPFSSF